MRYEACFVMFRDTEFDCILNGVAFEGFNDTQKVISRKSRNPDNHVIILFIYHIELSYPPVSSAHPCVTVLITGIHGHTGRSDAQNNNILLRHENKG